MFFSFLFVTLISSHWHVGRCKTREKAISDQVAHSLRWTVDGKIPSAGTLYASYSGLIKDTPLLTPLVTNQFTAVSKEGLWGTMQIILPYKIYIGYEENGTFTGYFTDNIYAEKPVGKAKCAAGLDPSNVGAVANDCRSVWFVIRSVSFVFCLSESIVVFFIAMA
jgi:hypothetical protein